MDIGLAKYIAKLKRCSEVNVGFKPGAKSVVCSIYAVNNQFHLKHRYLEYINHVDFSKTSAKIE